MDKMRRLAHFLYNYGLTNHFSHICNKSLQNDYTCILNNYALR